MLSEQEFYDSYKRTGRLPGEVGTRKQPLNEKQLKSKWKNYYFRELNQAEKKKNQNYEKDERWENIKAGLGKECRLIHILYEFHKNEMLRELSSNAGNLINTVDGAHYKSRSKYPMLIYYPDNVIPLNRFSHSMLDQGRDPISGDLISKDEVEGWWQFLLGEETYDRINYIVHQESVLRRNGIHCVTENTDLSCIRLSN